MYSMTIYDLQTQIYSSAILYSSYRPSQELSTEHQPSSLMIEFNQSLNESVGVLAATINTRIHHHYVLYH